MSTHSSELLSDTGISGREILLFKPSTENTSIEPASDNSEIRPLLEEGMTPDEVVLPYTEPDNSAQLILFK